MYPCLLHYPVIVLVTLWTEKHVLTLSSIIFFCHYLKAESMLISYSLQSSGAPSNLEIDVCSTYRIEFWVYNVFRFWNFTVLFFTNHFRERSRNWRSWSTFKRFRQIFTRKKYCLLSTVFTEMKATHSKKLLKAFEFYIVYVYLDHETFVSTDCLFLSKLLQYCPEDTVTYGIQCMHS